MRCNVAYYIHILSIRAYAVAYYSFHLSRAYVVTIFPVRSIGLHAYIISCGFVYIPVRSICMREYVHKVQCVTIFPVRPVRSSAVLSLTGSLRQNKSLNHGCYLRIVISKESELRRLSCSRMGAILPRIPCRN